MKTLATQRQEAYREEMPCDGLTRGIGDKGCSPSGCPGRHVEMFNLRRNFGDDDSSLSQPGHICCIGREDPFERIQDQKLSHDAVSGGGPRMHSASFAGNHNRNPEFHHSPVSDGSRRGEAGRTIGDIIDDGAAVQAHKKRRSDD